MKVQRLGNTVCVAEDESRTLKRVEAPCLVPSTGDEIVWSAWKHAGKVVEHRTE